MTPFPNLSAVVVSARIRPLSAAAAALAATVAAVAAVVASAIAPVPGTLPQARADQLPNPDWVALLSDYEKDYWKAPTSAADGGKVLDKATMGRDGDLAVAINHKGAEGADAEGLTPQRRRALVDADLRPRETMPDALGPVLGRYMREGIDGHKLVRVVDLFRFDVASTYQSKQAAMHPRPYLDRSVSAYNGDNDLAGLPATLDIRQSPSWGDHVPGYSNLQKNSSYPSGHTTTAYSWGVALAGMIPELAPQIMARTSEAGNNRIVLGVHYPLDVIGGRIGGSAQNGQYWHNEFGTSVAPAARQLRAYLTERCRTDGHGATLKACIADLKATGEGGYTNGFLDPVADEQVTDRASAVRVYGRRMTYGFAQKTDEKGEPFTAPRGAADVLRLAYPQLHADQRNAILAKTALDSGYPLWKSSDGWQRIDWAKALCARVTLDANGDVVKVETADDAEGAFDGPTVVNAQYADRGNHPDSDAAAGENGDEDAGPGPAARLLDRRALTAVALGTVAVAAVGTALRVRDRRRARRAA